jgi:adenylylsulfate reductase, subunit B
MTIRFDYDKCTQCKECYELCPLDIIDWNDEDDQPYIKYPHECQLCFICQVECPSEAVKVEVPLAFW